MPLMDPAVHLHGIHAPPLDDGHPREAIPHGGFRDYHYPNRQRAMSLLYHDHSHGQTGLHVYYGLGGAYIIDDPDDLALGLPTGDYDIPLMLQDRIFNADGSFRYIFDSNTRETGLLGDTILVNGVVQPYFKVERRKYRFPFLSMPPECASVSDATQFRRRIDSNRHGWRLVAETLAAKRD